MNKQQQRIMQFRLPVPSLLLVLGILAAVSLLEDASSSSSSSRFMQTAHAFTPPIVGLGALLNPVRGGYIEGISVSENKRSALIEASDFFVESFWTAKVGGGATKLTDRQRRSLEQSQEAEFNKRYGGGSSSGRRRTSELVLYRNSADEVIACAGVEVDAIPDGGLDGPMIAKAPLMSNLAVSRKYRRRGLAEALVAAVEELAQNEWGYDECYLYVERQNRAAIKLYQKLGYRQMWNDGSARTLLPTSKGDLESAPTVLVCMRKVLGKQGMFARLFG
jgi:GNAT superfamily N-acetyltransferase